MSKELKICKSDEMKCQILKITKQPSKYGGEFYYVFMKSIEDGSDYKTCIYPKCRNYQRWKPYLHEGIILDNLRIKYGNLIDADSQVTQEK